MANIRRYVTLEYDMFTTPYELKVVGLTKNECQEIASSFQGSSIKKITSPTCRLHDNSASCSKEITVPCECMFGIRPINDGTKWHITLFINFLAQTYGFVVKTYKNDEKHQRYSCLLEK